MLVNRLCLSWELGQGKLVGDVLEASMELIIKKHDLVNVTNLKI